MFNPLAYESNTTDITLIYTSTKWYALTLAWILMRASRVTHAAMFL